jgi:hypothetical protein
MRTTDFSKAPPQAQAECIFVGATRYSGPLAIFRLQFTWWRMVRQMKSMPGFRWYKIYYEFPFTLGTIGMFESRDAMMRFARGKHHRKLMQWITDGNRNGKGGYIRVYNAEAVGYTNGIWSADAPEVMAHVPHFTPVTGEVLGPKVAKGDDAHLTDAQRAAAELDALESRLRAEGRHPEQTGVWKASPGDADATEPPA